MNQSLINLWDRQPNEPSMWFDRFDRYYLSAGTSRHMLGAYNAWRAAEGKNKQPGKCPSSAWSRAAKKWDWKGRAEAFDDRQTEERRADERETRLVARKERLALIRTMKAELVVFLQKHRQELLESRDPSLHEVVRYTEMLLREERVELGDEPTARVDITTLGETIRVLGVDLGKL